MKMFERVQSDIVGLRGEVKSLEASVAELKRSTVARLDQSEAQISDLGTLAKAATMICFRCHGYVVEYIQLQCGHLFCLHCFGCKLYWKNIEIYSLVTCQTSLSHLLFWLFSCNY